MSSQKTRLFFVVKCFADDAMIYRCKVTSEVTVYSVGKNKKGKKRHQLDKKNKMFFIVCSTDEDTVVDLY